MTGTRGPPPKRIKPGGMEDRLNKARSGKKQYDLPPPRRKLRKRRPAAIESQYVPQLAGQSYAKPKQKYKNGTRIKKKFNGVDFDGEIAGFDGKYYKIEYDDGDREDMTLNQVRRYKAGAV